jgi:hypothetical protein
LCNQDGCVAATPPAAAGELIAVDAGHLSLKGSVFVAERILMPHFSKLLN